MPRTTKDTATATSQALVAAAGRGDEQAFDELHRRYGALAWRFALAITGRPDDATAAVAAGTGTSFTALRSGRFQADGHRASLCAATRNAALDLRSQGGAGLTPTGADGADPLLADAFWSLPERWRSVLWLRDAEHLDAGDVAPIVELTPEAVDQLAVRARRGLRERYLRSHVAATGSRNCSRAIVRLGALQDGTLDDKDQENLERHLRLCEDCAARAATVATLLAGLSSLAGTPAPALHDRSKAAWTAALATRSTVTGLSPRTEKVLAGVSALAAAVGVVGAALFSTAGDDDEPVASPLAPLVSEITTPRPVDLSDLTFPVSTPAANAGSARRSMAGTWTPSSAPAAEPAVVAEPTVDIGPGTPAAEAPASPEPAPQVQLGTEVADIPIAVDLGPEPGLTVGPISVGSAPEPGEDPLTLEGAPEQLDPVTDAVNDAVASVVETVEPVTTPLAPVTDPVVGGLGL